MYFFMIYKILKCFLLAALPLISGTYTLTIERKLLLVAQVSLIEKRWTFVFIKMSSFAVAGF